MNRPIHWSWKTHNTNNWSINSIKRSPRKKNKWKYSKPYSDKEKISKTKSMSKRSSKWKDKYQENLRFKEKVVLRGFLNMSQDQNLPNWLKLRSQNKAKRITMKTISTRKPNAPTLRLNFDMPRMKSETRKWESIFSLKKRRTLSKKSTWSLTTMRKNWRRKDLNIRFRCRASR